jgi:hypothetical protein
VSSSVFINNSFNISTNGLGGIFGIFSKNIGSSFFFFLFLILF